MNNNLEIDEELKTSDIPQEKLDKMEYINSINNKLDLCEQYIKSNENLLNVSKNLEQIMQASILLDTVKSQVLMLDESMAKMDNVNYSKGKENSLYFLTLFYPIIFKKEFMKKFINSSCYVFYRVRYQNELIASDFEKYDPSCNFINFKALEMKRVHLNTEISGEILFAHFGNYTLKHNEKIKNMLKSEFKSTFVPIVSFKINVEELLRKTGEFVLVQVEKITNELTQNLYHWPILAVEPVVFPTKKVTLEFEVECLILGENTRETGKLKACNYKVFFHKKTVSEENLVMEEREILDLRKELEIKKMDNLTFQMSLDSIVFDIKFNEEKDAGIFERFIEIGDTLKLWNGLFDLNIERCQDPKHTLRNLIKEPILIFDKL